MGLDHGLYVVEGSAGSPQDWEIGYEATGEYPERAVTWRKSNAVHRFIEEAWLRDNEPVETFFGPSMPNCEPVPLNPWVLKDLHSLCVRLIAGRDAVEAAAMLPVGEGFFFGHYEYDEWYWDQLEEAADDLAEVLARVETDPTLKVYYWAWW